MSESPQETASVQTNSYVLLDYTITVKDTGELVDTTLDEEAKKSSSYDASRVYEPRLVVVGKGSLLKAVEDEIIGLKESESKRFEIPPDKAFGARDPSKVKTIPLRKLKDLDRPLRVGSVISIDGREGVVRSVGSGRVQIDFNPYLAGKTLVCEATVRAIIRDDLEKVKHIVHSRIPEVPLDKFGIELSHPVVRISIPADAHFLPALQVAKRAIAREVKEAIQGLEKVVFIEEFV
ncbi:MAG: FKBP-type peptidyl-prolyl cis-trans isomerase [Nitrososphaerota archaeon]